jgi:hypothetical protein
MENKSLSDLTPNITNPRTMGKHDDESLGKGLNKYGDLGGIVFNVALNQLVGGHQRVRKFKSMGGESAVVITQKFDTPTATGTVALGYIKYNDEYYAYREVSWDNEAHDLAANVMANRAGGDFDLEKLADVNEIIRQQDAELLAFTGQTDDEIEKLNQLGSQLEPEQTEKQNTMTFKPEPEQAEIIDEALNYVLAKVHVTTGNMDIRANALTYICTKFLERLHDEQPQTAADARTAGLAGRDDGQTIPDSGEESETYKTQ